MRAITACLATATLVATAAAQPLEIPWYTIDAGGGTSSGGSFALTGTIGQHDAGGPLTGGNLAITGGFWAISPAIGSCPADLNGDDMLDFFDVQAFLGYFASHDLRADFTGDGVLDFFDVQVFLNTFAAGCP